jgi:hypothetical protein
MPATALTALTIADHRISRMIRLIPMFAVSIHLITTLSRCRGREQSRRSSPIDRMYLQPVRQCNDPPGQHHAPCPGNRATTAYGHRAGHDRLARVIRSPLSPWHCPAAGMPGRGMGCPPPHIDVHGSHPTARNIILPGLGRLRWSPPDHVLLAVGKAAIERCPRIRGAPAQVGLPSRPGPRAAAPRQCVETPAPSAREYPMRAAMTRGPA